MQLEFEERGDLIEVTTAVQRVVNFHTQPIALGNLNAISEAAIRTAESLHSENIVEFAKLIGQEHAWLGINFTLGRGTRMASAESLRAYRGEP